MGREDCVMIIDKDRPSGKCSFMVKLLYKFRKFLSSRRKLCLNHLAACMHLHSKDVGNDFTVNGVVERFQRERHAR